VIVHARSEQQVRQLRAAIAARLADCGLALNERKTRIVYCKDSTRRGCCEDERFDFLGYTFRPRLSRNKSGGQFVNFLPAASGDARKRMRREVRRWRLHLRPDKTLTDLARIFHPIIQGWINYYGRFYRSVLKKALRRIKAYLVRWAQCKCKRLRRTRQGAQIPGRRLRTPTRPVPPLADSMCARRLDDGSPVSADVHAGF
jgi:RNA-directed DNA polymerase